MTHLSERAQALTLAVPGNDLDAYMRAVNAVPVLSAEEEQRLGERLYYDQDLDAARSLVPVSLALCRPHRPQLHRFTACHWGDLVQEGKRGPDEGRKNALTPLKGSVLVSFAVQLDQGRKSTNT